MRRRGRSTPGSDACDTSDPHAATAVDWLNTAAIFRQPTALRNVIQRE
jgi:hypothetical protein